MKTKLSSDTTILIIGAGPTGLGAAWRLEQRGHHNWLLLEAEGYPGGLSASVVDDAGFTWDMGGHVQFSHYPLFDRVMDDLLGDDWLHHVRESWIWIMKRFVPYPFQRNIRYLPREAMWRCLKGLLDIAIHPATKKPTNFEELIRSHYGEGIAELFLLPDNFKRWAYPPSDLSHTWIDERLAKVDLERVIQNVIFERDDVSWGPNDTFRFPKTGGTGRIWQELAMRLPEEKIRYHQRVVGLDLKNRSIQCEGGESQKFDLALSTMPLSEMARASDQKALIEAAKTLRHSAVHVIGMGLSGRPPRPIETKGWMYFPEDDTPFYRATVFSNYSPGNVPDPEKNWSLMVEISESPVKPVELNRLEDDAINGALVAGLIPSGQEMETVWKRRLPYAYPTPTLERDKALDFLQSHLEKHGVFGRGRFGSWKYEVGNQDHCFMQGVEWVDHLFEGAEETTWRFPNTVNSQNASRNATSRS